MDLPEIPLTPQIPSPAQAIHPRRRRRGKIARLTREVREQVNLMMFDGIPYEDIIPKLGDAGKHLSKHCLSEWHCGGFKDWLKDQPWLDELHATLDFAATAIQDPDTPKIREAGICIAIKQMYSLITQFDPSECKQKLADDPTSYSRVLNALSKLAEIGLQYDRHNSETATHRAGRRPKAATTAGISPDMVRQYEREFGLLRRPAKPPTSLSPGAQSCPVTDEGLPLSPSDGERAGERGTSSNTLSSETDASLSPGVEPRSIGDGERAGQRGTTAPAHQQPDHLTGPDATADENVGVSRS